MNYTLATREGLRAGLPYWGYETCPSCGLVFAAGIEGGADSPDCDKCWADNKGVA